MSQPPLRSLFAAGLVVLVGLFVVAASTENVVLVTHQTAADAAPRVVHTGVDRNTWRKTERGWRLAERVFVADRMASGPQGR